MTHDLVSLLGQYGLALVFANVLIEQIGLPVPALPTLVVAGAFATEGKLSMPLLFAVALLASGLGLLIGLITGFSRWTDAIVMRIMDGLMSIPAVLIAIALMALTRASIRLRGDGSSFSLVLLAEK